MEVHFQPSQFLAKEISKNDNMKPDGYFEHLMANGLIIALKGKVFFI